MHQPLPNGRFSIRFDEAPLWPEALALHAALEALGEPRTVEDILGMGHPFTIVCLLMRKGGLKLLSEGAVKRALSLSQMDGDYYAFLEAAEAGELRWTEWQCTWHHEGVWPVKTDQIARLLGDEQGRLADATRLVLGPDRVVAQLQFFPDRDPEVVAVYRVVREHEPA